jgi:hypothetical protein
MPEHSKPIRLATAAFHAALSNEPVKAGRYLQRISDECGGDGLGIAMRAWIDTYADHATGGEPPRSRGNVAFIQEGTGQLDREDSDRLPPEVRWAGQIIAARCADDRERYMQLIGEMPDGGAEIGMYVATLLLTIARTVNGLPRGFARMGVR